MLLSPCGSPGIQPVFPMPHAQRVLSPHWPCLDASFPSARLHFPPLLHVAPSPPKLPSAPLACSQLRDIMTGFQRKSKQPEVNFPNCSPQVCLFLCPHVACDSLQAPCTPSCLFSPLPAPCPQSPPPPFSFSIFGEILNGFCLMMTHLCPGEIFLCYFS